MDELKQPDLNDAIPSLTTAGSLPGYGWVGPSVESARRYEDLKLQRRYALLNAAAKVGNGRVRIGDKTFWDAETVECVNRAEALLAAIERRET